MKKVLVTGGCGFIGHHLVKKLLKTGYEVSVFDNQQRGSIENLKDVEKDIKYYEGDITRITDLNKAVNGVDSIIHLAFINGTKNFYSMPSKVIDIGICGLLNVYNCAKWYDVKELLIASSSETYQKPSIIPTPENVPLIIPDVTNPRYSYGGTKILYELMAQHYHREDFDRVITFRPHNIYGTNMGKDHVIQELIDKIKNCNRILPWKRKPVTLLGDGTQTRAFCHIDDFCDGINILLDHGKDGNIYHIGNEEEITIGDLCKKLFNKMGCDLEIEYSEAPKGETNRRCPDISKLKKLGYSPKINLDIGLKTIL